MKLPFNLILLLSYFGSLTSSKAQISYLTNDINPVLTADSSGIYTNNYTFSAAHLFPKKKWKGDWIWLNKKVYRDYQNTYTEWINNKENTNEQYRALFRKNFILKESPPIAILSISADVSFRAYINGEFVCQGPVNIGSDYLDTLSPEHWFFTTHDVRKYLKSGKNTLAVEVYSFGMAVSETTSGEGRFICDLDVGLNQTLLSTDSTWRCKHDSSFSSINGLFAYHASADISDWKGIGFDDNEWPHASINTTAKTKDLLRSQIPTTIRFPLNALNIRDHKANTDAGSNELTFFSKVHSHERFTLDFGKNISAYYTFSLTAHKGDTVKINPREKSVTNRPFVYICKEGQNTYTIPYLNVFRYLTIELVSDQGMKVNSIQALYFSYPVSYTGSFSCSDTFYTKLWDIIRWTTQLCMNSLYLDSPLHQEPIACTGDYLIESLSNYYAFGDPWLARQDLLKTAKMLKKNDYKMFHTSYSLLWVQMLCHYFQYTADSNLVKELLPHVNKLNDLFATYLDENYLLSQAPNYMFMDWIKIDRFNAHHPPAVIGMGYLSAFYYKSLRDAAQLNLMENNKSKSKANEQLAEKIKEAMNHWLWDEDKGLFKDGIPFKTRVKPHQWLPADEKIVTYSPHVNTLAVLYDIAPKNKQASIMDYVIHQSEIELQPYFMYFVLSALTNIGKFSAAGLELINKWEKGIDLETYTLKENWQDQTEFGYTGDFSHAWGGSPLYFLSRIILGITPGKPGYEEIRIDPYADAHLNWAKGTVPLKNGKSVIVSWERQGKSNLKYYIEIPGNYHAVLHHPAKLYAYDLRVNNQSRGKAQVAINLAEGRHLIEYISTDE